MNKKGFTLIELLAVIVILAVIMLIVTPLITSTIASSRKNSQRISAQKYVSIVEEKITEAILEYPNIEIENTNNPNDMYTWNCTNCAGNNKIDIEFRGTAPKKAALTYDQNDGKIRGKLLYANGCWEINDKGNLSDIQKTDNFCK